MSIEQLCQQVCCALSWGMVLYELVLGSTHLALLDSVARRDRLDAAQAVMHRFSHHLSSGDMVNDGGLPMKLLAGLAGVEAVMKLVRCLAVQMPCS